MFKIFIYIKEYSDHKLRMFIIFCKLFPDFYHKNKFIDQLFVLALFSKLGAIKNINLKTRTLMELVSF